MTSLLRVTIKPLAITSENSLSVFHQVKHVTQQSHSEGIFTNEKWKHMSRQIFTATLFTITPMWKTGNKGNCHHQEWVNKLYVHRMESKELPTDMCDIRNSVSCERSRTEKSTRCMIPFLWNCEKGILISKDRSQIRVAWSQAVGMGDWLYTGKEEPFGMMELFYILTVEVTIHCIYLSKLIEGYT